MRMTRWTLVTGALTLVMAACGDGPADNDPSTTAAAPTTTVGIAAPTTTTSTTSAPAATTTTAVAPTPDVVLVADGWPTLTDAVYEGWAIVDSAPVSTGRFNVVADELVDEDGSPIGDGFVVDQDVSTATAFIVSIEPLDDPDPTPSATKLVAGDLTSGSAELRIDHPDALGTDFSAAMGAYVLATPTDGNRDTDEFSGIWFLVFPGPTAGLDLPALPEGWNYEGWTVLDGVRLTTGTFRVVDRSDDAAPFSGTVRTPNFPGEDFLMNPPDGLAFPTDIRGSLVLVTIEPAADTDPAPFGLTILDGEIPLDAQIEPVEYPLDGSGFVAPSGTVTIP